MSSIVITLTHKFVKVCYDSVELLKGVEKLSTFCTKLEKQANTNEDLFKYTDYVGWGFECFGEALLKLSPIDNRIGVYNYQPNKELDTGVDGYGIGLGNNHPATVQFKYKSKHDSLLTANDDRLTNFGYASQNRYGVLVEDVHNMLVITTAEDLHYFTKDKMLMNKVRCVGYQDLRRLVDNNFAFWQSFRQLMYGA